MPKKLDSCVEQVKDSDQDESSAYAICVDSTGLSPKMKKGIDPVLNPVHMGGVESHVDLKAQMAAREASMGQGLYGDMQKFLMSIDDYDTRKGFLHTMKDMYDVELYKKAPNQYSCTVRKGDDGTLFTEINDQTLEIMCQIICSKLGEDAFFYPNIEKQEDMRDMMEQEDERLSMNPLLKDQVPGGLADDADPRDFDPDALNEGIDVEMEHTDNNSLASEIAMDHLTEDEDYYDKLGEMEGKSVDLSSVSEKKLTIEMDDKEICIKIRKSGDEVMTESEIIKKSEEEKKPADAENTKPDTEVASAEELGIEENAQPAEETGKDLIAQDDAKASGEELNPEDEAPSADLNGDTEVEEGMGEAIEGEEGMDAEMQPEEGMEAEGMDESENLEFVRSSEFEGGVQHWYKDKITGKIVEKETAPDGSEMGGDVAALASKLDVVMQKLDSLLSQEGEEGMEMEGEEVQEEGMEEGEEAEMDIEAEDSEEGEDISEDEFDQLVSETADETQKEDSQASFNGDGSGEVMEDADREPPKPKNEFEEKDEDMAKAKKKEKIAEDLEEKVGAKIVDGVEEMAEMEAEETVEEHQEDMHKKKAKKACKAIKKALEEKYPALKGEALKKAIVKSYTLMTKSFDKMPPVLDTMSKEEIDQREKEIKDMEAHGEGQSKKFLVDFSEEKDHEIDRRKKKKQMKKSRLGRMWKVFNIDMPESLEGEENIAKANEGIKQLQKCIMKQGKDQAEINKVVNRAVIEKYDLFDKGNKFFANEKIWKGGNYVYDGQEATMDNLENDRDNRFAIKEYVAESEQLDSLKQGDNMAKSVKDIIAGPKAEWDGFKDYQERVAKSEPREHEVIAKSDSDQRFSVKDYEGKEEKLVEEKETGINKAIQEAIETKPEELSFGDRYQVFDESKIKMAKSRKTDAELKANEFSKRIWGEGLEEDGKEE